MWTHETKKRVLRKGPTWKQQTLALLLTEAGNLTSWTWSVGWSTPAWRPSGRTCVIGGLERCCQGAGDGADAGENARSADRWPS